MKTRQIVHYRNLSRGLLCPCFTHAFKVVRIQSTHCEQKRWDQIIHEVGADFLYTLAIDDIIIVHDFSERDRETRACWQGLSWLRFAMYKTWIPDFPPAKEKSRGGMLLNPYWEHVYRNLDRSTISLLRYYTKFRKELGDNHHYIHLRSCYARRKSVETLLAPSLFAQAQEQAKEAIIVYP